MKNKKIILGVLISLFTLFIFSGCGEKDLATQKKECKEAKKKFTVEKVMNIRTGEYELRGKCK